MDHKNRRKLLPVNGLPHSDSFSSPQVRSLKSLSGQLFLTQKSRRPTRQPLPPIVPLDKQLGSIVTNRKAVVASPQRTLLSLTQKKLTLALPVPPSINHQYATVNGRRVLSSTGRRYKASVAQQILVALLKAPHRKDLLHNLRTHSLKFSIKFFFTSALRRDIDGGLKIAQDAICDALEINDNRIVEIHLYKTIDASCPRMECSLSIKPSSTVFPKPKTPQNTESKMRPTLQSSKFKVQRSKKNHIGIK